MIEINESYLNKFQKLLVSLYNNLCKNINTLTPISNLINRTGKLLKQNEWKNSDVLDLSTMKSENIFINEFSNGNLFKTNIKSVNQMDLVYGSIRPYFKKAGFALDVDYIAGTVFSFNPVVSKDYYWLLACISSEGFHKFTSINSQGTKMPIINWDTFIKFKIPYDSKSVCTFNEIIKPLFEISVSKMRQIRKLRKIKSILLQKYF